MNEPSDQQHEPSFVREKIIGLGENSVRKSYYPQLQQRLQEVEAARREIAESEARYRYLIEHISEVIFSFDADGRINYVSPSILDLGGWKPGQLVGERIAEFVHPDDCALFLSNFRGGSNAEFRFRRVDGDYRFVRLSLGISDPEEPGGFAGILRDITAEIEREKLQQQLDQTQKLESIGRLAGGVAHDFNNLLSIIMGNAELILQDLPEDSPFLMEVQEIFKTSERGSALTRQLLAFARKQTVKPKILDLNETIGNMLKMLQRLLGENIDLAWMPGACRMMVKMDPTQLDQVLANLCVNARDAIGEHGMLSIETRVVSHDETYCAEHPGEGLVGTFIQLAVTDNGCGMSKETLENIFEPFFTTKKAGEGTGLGLATVYGIVKQNQGFITTYSEPGKGTTFKVHIPREEVSHPEKGGDSGEALMHRGTETVLVVEDEAHLLRVAKRALEKLGYTVIAINNPEEAIEWVKSGDKEIHVLLSDIIMPQMNGIKMAEQIHALRPEIIRVFMSGYADHAAVRHGLVDQGLSFLQKPFSIKELSDKMREAIDLA